MTYSPFAVSALIALLAATAGQAQDSTPPETDHSGHDMAGMAPPDDPATAAYMAANARMHADMAVEFTGNPDVDFIRGMIPHHQGAVEMAKIVLQYGSDPEVRKLAEAVIAAQEAEIAWMQDWLAKNPAE